MPETPCDVGNHVLCAGYPECDCPHHAEEAQLAPPCGSCGHPGTAHQHYRPGTDCGLCDCRALA